MQPGGVNDIITHFIGHLDQALESLRARIAYDEAEVRDGKPEARTVGGAEPLAHAPDVEVPDSGRVGLAQVPDNVPSPAEPVSPLLVGAFADRFTPTAVVGAPPPLPPLSPAGGASGAGAVVEPPEPGIRELQLTVHQSNTLSDRDAVGPAHALGGAYPRDMIAALDGARDVVLQHHPLELPVSDLSTGTFIEWAEAHAKIANESPADDSAVPSLTPGRHIDGQLDQSGEDIWAIHARTSLIGNTDQEIDQSTAASAFGEDPLVPGRPMLEIPKYAEGMTGQVAVLGGNEAENVAQIGDIAGAVQTMVVGGNWHQTNAIVQLNVYSDADRAIVDGEVKDLQVDGGGNSAHNVAEFVRDNPGDDMSFRGFSGANLRVDVIDGDFHDVKIFNQTNVVSDGDVVTQSDYQAFSVITTGLNEQVNVATFNDILSRYDLIVVGGDYHSANLIFQTNIILDDDLVILDAAGADGDPGLHTGQNWMLNNARIQDLGVADGQPMTDSLVGLLGALDSGDVAPNAALAHGLAGNGSGTLNVLYVSGDFFNLNLVNQINVIYDADTAAQLVGGDGATQLASTGNNAALNTADISTVGAVDAMYVGGQHYDDATLVQASIVVADDDQALAEDGSELAPEVVAFTGGGDDAHASQDAPLFAGAPTADPDSLGSVLT